MDSPQSLGEIIQRWRDARGWTLQDVADRAGTSKGHISDIENERYSHKTSWSVAMRILAALDLYIHVNRRPQGKGEQWVATLNPATKSPTAPADSPEA